MRLPNPSNWGIAVVALVALAAAARGVSAEDCVLQVLSDGDFDLIVAGEYLGRDLAANEVHIFETALNDDDAVAVRWRPRGGNASSQGFLLVARTMDGSKVFGTGDGWYCSHNETARWAQTSRIGGLPWRTAPLVSEGEVAMLAEGVPFAQAIGALSSPAYLKALAKWRDAPVAWVPVDLTGLWEASTALERGRYFSPAAILAGRINVYYRGQLLTVEQLSRTQLLETRDYLEAALFSPGNVGIPEQEGVIRKQLRGIRQALGPNTDRRQAMTWRVVCILATNVDVTWKDKGGKTHRFRSVVRDPERWKQCIDREMGSLSDIIFEKSWGRINVVGETFIATAPLTSLRGGERGYWLSSRDVRPVVDQVFPRWRAPSLIVWVPSDGEGGRPPWRGAAHVAAPSARTRGAALTVCYTTWARLEKEGGWASRTAGGLLHEYWHNVQRAMTHVLGYKGFVPSNHRAEDFAMLKAEIREQGLPEPTVQYDEFLGSWPTWQMCQELERRYR